MGKLKYFTIIWILFLIFFIAWSVCIYITAPVDDLKNDVTYSPPFKHIVHHAGLGLSTNLTLDEMPLSLIFATLAVEDNGFINHPGVNIQRIKEDIENYLLTNTPLNGASTITQQVVKNAFLNSKRSFYRKYVEIIYAIKMERHFSKEQIFTLYANMVETGPGLYGYHDAAQYYFNKEPKQLEPVESAFIVSLLPSPMRFSRWFREGGDEANNVERIRIVLAREMIREKYFFQQYHLSDIDNENIFLLIKNTSYQPAFSSQDFAIIDNVADTQAKQFVASHHKFAPNVTP